MFISLIRFLFLSAFVISICKAQDSLRFELEKIYENDQKIRIELQKSIEVYGINSIIVDSLKNVMIIKDSLNETYIKSFFNEYGFLGKSVVGEKGIEAEWLVIQHSTDLQFQQKWLPEIWRLSSIGELPNEMAAMLDDRLRLRTGLRQLYGTQFKWNPDNNEWQLEEIEDPENINRRRLELGMGTIEEYFKSFNNSKE